MPNSRTAVLLVMLAFFPASCGSANVQRGDISAATVKQQLLSLNVSNNGQHLSATVGQQIQMTLGTVGPKYYGTPQISSPAIRLESVELAGPQNPGGPTYVYFFEATAEGEAQVKIPVIDSENPDRGKGLTFTVTIDVGSAAKNSPEMYASMTLDQANTAPWKNAWTNLQNDVWQTFTPSLPRLTRVEVELVLTNPDVLTNNGGASDGEVVMSLHNAEGEVLAWISKTVPVAECSHVLFIFPDGGLRVSPGRVYSIRVRNAGIFGWKYVVGGYSKGAASFNGKPLLPDTRSTFLFRTFGAH
jgi:hypothetical protein